MLPLPGWIKAAVALIPLNRVIIFGDHFFFPKTLTAHTVLGLPYGDQVDGDQGDKNLCNADSPQISEVRKM